MLRSLSLSKRLALNLIVLVVLGVIALNTFDIQGSRNEHLTMADSSPDAVRVLPTELVQSTESPLALVPPEPAPLPPPTARAAEPPPALPAEDHVLEERVLHRSLNAPASKTPLPPVTWNVFVHLPPNTAHSGPLRVLLVLHGMGGSGEKFAQSLIPDADKNNWVVIAPTVPYERDYMDPTQLMDEDLRFTVLLNSLLDSLPEKLGMSLYQHALVFGFSRGAQLGHRFALLYPDRVETVATISAGSYTLPLQAMNKQTMDFPYGIADLAQRIGQRLDMEAFRHISFYIAVGDQDNRTSDVSRAFDAYTGRNRVERARAFAAALQTLGMDVHLTIFPGAGHEVTADMRESALGYLRQDELADRWTN